MNDYIGFIDMIIDELMCLFGCVFEFDVGDDVIVFGCIGV